MPQQSILNFMPAAPFKSLKKTLIQVSVTFFLNDLRLFTLTVLEPKLAAPDLGTKGEPRGGFPDSGEAAGMRCAVAGKCCLGQGGEEVPSHPRGARARVRRGTGRLWFSSYSRQAFLESKRGCFLAALAEWFGILSRLSFVAGFTRGKYLIPMERLGQRNDGFPR